MSVTAVHSHLLRLSAWNTDGVMGSPNRKWVLGKKEQIRSKFYKDSPWSIGCVRSLKHWADLLLFHHASCVYTQWPRVLHPSFAAAAMFVFFFLELPLFWLVFLIFVNYRLNTHTSLLLLPRTWSLKPASLTQNERPTAWCGATGMWVGASILLELGHSWAADSAWTAFGTLGWLWLYGRSDVTVCYWGACECVKQCGQNCVCVFATAAQAQTWRPRRCAPVVVIRPRLQDWVKIGLWVACVSCVCWRCNYHLKEHGLFCQNMKL